MNFKCDNCGQTVESGLANITNHQFNCGAKYTEKIDDTFSMTVHPYLRLTPLPNANEGAEDSSELDWNATTDQRFD